MLVNYINEFNSSYKNCLERIDPNITYPYNESEIFGTYFEELHEFKKQYIGITDIVPLNPSILRSMLVMDLYGEDSEYKQIIFKYYVELLNKYYENDHFSLKYNKPNVYNYSEYFDYVYFSEKNLTIPKILNDCFKYCYKKNHDIFADNTYEIIGPVYNKNNMMVIHRFVDILSGIIEIIYFDNIIHGTIDMFGHSDINWKNPSYVLLHNGILIEEYELFLNKIKMCLEINKNGLFSECIESYKNRYPNFLSNKLNIIENKLIKPKITNRELLAQKIII